MNRDAIVGSLLGTAVGDALGLPYEGVSKKRAARLLGPASRHRFLFGRGMISDDTEHSCMVAQSLIEAHSGAGQLDADRFVLKLAWRFRGWLILFPAGVGKATALSILRLWIGFRPGQSGVFSAGNGPAMRSAILGAAVDDEAALLELVRRSAKLTHSDPKATFAAIAVALAARESRQQNEVAPEQWLANVKKRVGADGNELIELLDKCVASVLRRESTEQFAESLGLEQGVSGYSYHTVPVAIHAWLSNPDDLNLALKTIVECGGDADTTAAIVGGIVGARVGTKGVPAELLGGIWEWPRSVRWMTKLGNRLAEALDGDKTIKPPMANPLGILFRNLFFLAIVLSHGFRRLAPPY